MTNSSLKTSLAKADRPFLQVQLLCVLTLWPTASWGAGVSVTVVRPPRARGRGRDCQQSEKQCWDEPRNVCAEVKVPFTRTTLEEECTTVHERVCTTVQVHEIFSSKHIVICFTKL